MNARTHVSIKKVRDLILETLPRTASGPSGEIIFGPDGALDSLDLVNFLADLEYRIDQVFGCEVVLASEKAMSRSRSPFRDVDSLSGYIIELLSE